MESRKDYLLLIRFDPSDRQIDDAVQSFLYLAECSGSTADGSGATAYFASAAARDAAQQMLAALDGVALAAEDRDRVDWLLRYEQSLEPMHIGGRFVVAPDPALIPPGTDRLALVIPQEQAFGTGSHETTSLCIELLEDVDCAGKRGLDIGAGSGILALAMLRLQAARVVAFDNDPDAFGALRDNRSRNGVTEHELLLLIGSHEAVARGSFDLVTMNIVPEVILPALPQVVGLLAPGACIILSGVLLERAGEIQAAAQSLALKMVTERTRGEWWAGVFAR